MSPSALNGLNIVHTQQQTPYLSDSQDLLNVPHFSDLNAQLDLWSNLTFESDEPLGKDFGNRSQDDERDEDSDNEGPARLDAHENVVNAIPLPNPAPTSVAAAISDSSLDLNTILSAFGIDPYLVPSVATSQPPAQMASTSLAQLLSSYPNAPESFMPLSHLQHPVPATQMRTQPAPPALGGKAASQKRAESPSVKRTWNRKSSTVTASTPTPPASQPESSEAKSELGNGDATPGSNLSPAEDKRKRNTAASARFRLKKKEREVALERKSKDLETRVSELERECETLRRENGWLKGLVVGVTGVGAGSTPPSPGTFSSVSMVGMKRRREESGDAKPVVASS